MVVLPEFIILATALVVFVLDLVCRADRPRTWLVPTVLAGLAGAILCTLRLMPEETAFLGGRFVVDSVGWWFRLIFLIAASGTIAVSADGLNGRAEHQEFRLENAAEYCVVLLFSLAGMMCLISSREIITLYVSLELSTIPLFILAAWQRSSKSLEAGIKYLILGAISSSLLLYGFGLLYGISGETSFTAMREHMTVSPVCLFAATLILAGIGFKLALVPFQMWAPEVYEGAPTPITAFLSVASKSAGAALAFIVFYKILRLTASHFDSALALIAACTMTLGNAVALVQHNIKRFMAFSSISQAGYLIMGFIGLAPEGVPAMMYFLLGYVFTNIAVFAVIIFYANATGREHIEDYAGLSTLQPVLSLAMLVSLFSLAGIPPLAGFVGKFFLFSVASKAGFHWLVGLAAVNSTVSLYYYLRIVRQMYIEPSPPGARKLPVPMSIISTLSIATAAVVMLGILPVFYDTIHKQTLSYSTAP